MQPERHRIGPTVCRGTNFSVKPLTNIDEDLADVTRILAGDTAAFEGIVRRWQGPLVNMAWRYCRDRGRAEEMCQDAFIHAWRGLAQWRRESRFSTWLFALAANVFRSELKRFPTVTLAMDEIAEPSGGATQRDSLYYFYEMDVGQAARTMGLPEGTLKGRLARARDLLRQRFPHLNEEFATPPILIPKKEASR